MASGGVTRQLQMQPQVLEPRSIPLADAPMPGSSLLYPPGGGRSGIIRKYREPRVLSVMDRRQVYIGCPCTQRGRAGCRARYS
jgi:hypothetical protein